MSADAIIDGAERTARPSLLMRWFDRDDNPLERTKTRVLLFVLRLSVNVASRMASSGIAGSDPGHRDALEDRYRFVRRGAIDVKGLGVTDTYLLEGCLDG